MAIICLMINLITEQKVNEVTTKIYQRSYKPTVILWLKKKAP